MLVETMDNSCGVAHRSHNTTTTTLLQSGPKNGGRSIAPLTGTVSSYPINYDALILGKWNEACQEFQNALTAYQKYLESADRDTKNLLPKLDIEDLKKINQTSEIINAKKSLAEWQTAFTHLLNMLKGQNSPHYKILHGHYQSGVEHLKEVDVFIDQSRPENKIRKELPDLDVSVEIETSPCGILCLGWPKLGGSCLDLLHGGNSRYAANYLLNPVMSVIYVWDTNNRNIPLARISTALDAKNKMLVVISPIKTNENRYNFAPIVLQFLKEWADALEVALFFADHLPHGNFDREVLIENGFYHTSVSATIAGGSGIDHYSDFTDVIEHSEFHEIRKSGFIYDPLLNVLKLDDQALATKLAESIQTKVLAQMNKDPYSQLPLEAEDREAFEVFLSRLARLHLINSLGMDTNDDPYLVSQVQHYYNQNGELAKQALALCSEQYLLQQATKASHHLPSHLSFDQTWKSITTTAKTLGLDLQQPAYQKLQDSAHKEWDGVISTQHVSVIDLGDIKGNEMHPAVRQTLINQLRWRNTVPNSKPIVLLSHQKITLQEVQTMLGGEQGGTFKKLVKGILNAQDIGAQTEGSILKITDVEQFYQQTLKVARAPHAKIQLYLTSLTSLETVPEELQAFIADVTTINLSIASVNYVALSFAQAYFETQQ